MLARLWYRYVNADHFLIGSLAVVVSLLFKWVWFIPGIALLTIGLVHEWLDGDLFVGGSTLGPPWEGIKDVLWFVAPLAWYSSR